MRNRLRGRIKEARGIINHEAIKNNVGIPVIHASVFRCFLSVLERDNNLDRDDLGAYRVWAEYLQESGLTSVCTRRTSIAALLKTVAHTFAVWWRGISACETPHATNARPSAESSEE
jgi:hypothetical protein